MSQDQLQAFLQAVNADVELRNKLSALTDLDAVLAIAREAGFEIDSSKLDLHESIDLDSAELDDHDLEQVAGGGMEGTLCILGGMVGTIASIGYAIGKKNG